LQGELVATYLRIAIINYEIGPDQDWLGPFQKAAAAMEDLVRRNPDIAALQSLHAGVYRPIGIPLRITRPAEALVTAAKACALWEDLVRAHRTAPGLLNDLAAWYTMLGHAHLVSGQLEDALRCHRRSCEIREKLVETNPTVPRYRGAL